MQDGSCVDFFVDSGCNLEIYPDYGEPSRPGMCHVVRLSASRVSFQFFVKGTSAFPAQMWLGFHSVDAGWSGWFQGVIATPPEEYDLSLVEGWTDQSGNSCRYAKTQEGICVVTFRAIPNSAIQGGQTTIATLPTGFRPSGLVHGVCIRTDFSSDVIALWLHPDGGLRINAVGGLPEGVGVMGELVFVTVN